MTEQVDVTDKSEVTDEDRRRAIELADLWQNGKGTFEALVALALAEERVRAEAPWRKSHKIVEDQRNELVARIADLEAERDRLQKLVTMGTDTTADDVWKSRWRP